MNKKKKQFLLTKAYSLIMIGKINDDNDDQEYSNNYNMNIRM